MRGREDGRRTKRNILVVVLLCGRWFNWFSCGVVGELESQELELRRVVGDVMCRDPDWVWCEMTSYWRRVFMFV